MDVSLLCSGQQLGRLSVRLKINYIFQIVIMRYGNKTRRPISKQLLVGSRFFKQCNWFSFHNYTMKCKKLQTKADKTNEGVEIDFVWVLSWFCLFVFW